MLTMLSLVAEQSGRLARKAQPAQPARKAQPELQAQLALPAPQALPASLVPLARRGQRVQAAAPAQFILHEVKSGSP
jgi:hypothetical protein